ncbi:protein of unknown function [Tepidibacter aestuarii]|nr:protein of unknown function [Tepidibacter aestuarii]
MQYCSWDIFTNEGGLYFFELQKSIKYDKIVWLTIRRRDENE